MKKDEDTLMGLIIPPDKPGSPITCVQVEIEGRRCLLFLLEEKTRNRRVDPKAAVLQCTILPSPQTLEEIAVPREIIDQVKNRFDLTAPAAKERR